MTDVRFSMTAWSLYAFDKRGVQWDKMNSELSRKLKRRVKIQRMGKLSCRKRKA